jgi:hypothetical protein
MRATAIHRTARALSSANDLLDRTGDALTTWNARRQAQTHRAILAGNRDFSQRHRGRRCFVLGTGPSIAKQDLGPLASELTFTMGGFWKHPIVDAWQPTYYCVADPLFFDGAQAGMDFMRDASRRMQSTHFFVPRPTRQLIEANQLLPAARTSYVEFIGALNRSGLTELDLCEFLPAVQSVSQFGIMLALYMGCSPIYLTGLDHDWLAHRGPDRHFYEGYAGLENHPRLKPVLGDWSYRLMCENVITLWRGYEAIAAFAAKQGVEIVNVTAGGFLDVFPRGRLEDVLTR